MFVRVVRSSVDPAKIEDALALGDEITAAMKRQAGFVSSQGESAEPRDRLPSSARGRLRMPRSFRCGR